MKKRLLIAAVAATMSVAATADISITGDAYVSFASQKVASTVSDNANDDDQRVRVKIVGSAGDTKVVAVIRNGGATRVNQTVTPIDSEEDFLDSDVNTNGLHMDSLYVTTKAGPVSIKAGDYWGTIGLGARSKDAGKKNALSVSTEVGGWKLGLFTANGSFDNSDKVNAAAAATATAAAAVVAAGTDADLIAAAAAATEAANVDTAAAAAAAGNNSLHISASGKAGPVTVGLVHNPDDFTDLTAQATFGGVSIAVEKWIDKTVMNNDATLIHIGGEISNFKWEIAQIKNDKATDVTYNNTPAIAVGAVGEVGDVAYLPAVAAVVGVIGVPQVGTAPTGSIATNDFISGSGNYAAAIEAVDAVDAADAVGEVGDVAYLPAVAAVVGDISSITTNAYSTGKLAPLGSMLIGTNARGRTATAVLDVSDFTKILGVAVSTQLAGNTVKVIYTKNTIGINGLNDKVTGTELIISRPLGDATLTANIGKISGVSELTQLFFGGVKGNATNTGLRLDVKF